MEPHSPPAAQRRTKGNDFARRDASGEQSFLTEALRGTFDLTVRHPMPDTPASNPIQLPERPFMPVSDRSQAEAVFVLTANDLLSGRVVWWTGERWTERFAVALRTTDSEALEALAHEEEAADRVVGAALVRLGADGGPAGLREARRLSGPSIALPDWPVAPHGA